MIDRDQITRRVISKLTEGRLENADYEVVADFAKKHIDNPDKLQKFFDAFQKRNNLTPVEKRKLLMKLKEEKVDILKPAVKEIFEYFGTI